MQLRSYQTAAVNSTLGHLRAGQHPLLVAPTGSGKTVIAAAVAAHYRAPLVIAHRREIIDQSKRIFGRHCSARSVQGISSITELDGHDLLIIDEAHRAAAKSYRQIIERLPEVPRLGLTATPLRTDGQGLCDSFSALVECSNVRDLIAEGYLVPYRAFEAPDEALRQLAWMKRCAGDYEPRALGDLMNQPRLVGDVVREYKRLGGGRRAVAFAVNVEHSKAIAEALRAEGVRSIHVDRNASGRFRQAALDSLAAGEVDVLCNVNLFTEGWDCPAVSCVIMARPTASLTLYLQSVGRGLRPSEGKKDLVILDHAGNMQRHGYPDVDRAWSLESEIQRAKRESEEAERERRASLGFDSLEAELEEKRRLTSVTYTASEVSAMVGRSHLTAFLAPMGIKSVSLVGRGRGHEARYLKSDIDPLIEHELRSYSSARAAEVLGIPIGNVNRYLSIRNVKMLGGRKSQATRYLKSAVDEIKVQREAYYGPAEVAAKLGLNRRMLRSALRIRGVEAVAYESYLKADIDRLFHEDQQSYSASQAQELLGRRGAIAYYARRFGVKPIPGRGSSAIRYLRSDLERIKALLQENL